LFVDLARTLTALARLGSAPGSGSDVLVHQHEIAFARPHSVRGFN